MIDARAGAPVLIEGGSGPITTKGQVDDKAVRRELSLDIAVCVWEERSRCALQSEGEVQNLTLDANAM